MEKSRKFRYYNIDDYMIIAFYITFAVLFNKNITYNFKILYYSISKCVYSVQWNLP